VRPGSTAVIQDVGLFTAGVFEASASTGIGTKSRESYMACASETTVEVRHSEKKETGRNGLPKISRILGHSSG
jgi:hypothetical protein